MRKRLKQIIGNLFAAMSGVYIGRNPDLLISNLAQHTPQFCEKCGKILDVKGDAASISRGDYCLECYVNQDDE